MEQYFAQTPIINYIGATLWIVAPVVITLLVLGAIVRKSRWGTIIVGALLIVSSIPVALMSELSISGCCGAPSTGYEGVGYVIGIVVATVGVGIIIFGKKLVKENPVK